MELDSLRDQGELSYLAICQQPHDPILSLIDVAFEYCSESLSSTMAFGYFRESIHGNKLRFHSRIRLSLSLIEC